MLELRRGRAELQPEQNVIPHSPWRTFMGLQTRGRHTAWRTVRKVSVSAVWGWVGGRWQGP